jgi:CRP-like cAMP-binding protein
VAVGAGGLFFDEGDPGDRLFVFINGSAVVEKRTRDGWTTLATLKPGEAFGEMAVVDQLPRSARVRAVANSLALSLTRARLDGSPDVAAAVYRNIAVMQTLRLRATNERLAGSTDKD